MHQGLPRALPRRDARVMGLVGGAHAFSHFYQLLLPPLFPMMHAEEGWSYLELSLLVSVLYAVSGVLQPLAGFVVDKVGPRLVLYSGLATCASGAVLIGLLPGYAALVVLTALIGAGNSVFHPCDYTVLSHNVSEGRVGKGFGVHAFAGYVGYAAAPVTMVMLAGALGWRVAVITAGVAGLGYLALVLVAGHRSIHVERGEDATSLARVPLATELGVLASPAVILCFLFFCAIAMAQIGMQTFTPATLSTLFATSGAISNGAVTAFLLAVMVGILGGGFLADRTQAHHLVAVGCLIPPTLVFLLPGFFNLPTPALWSLYAIAGVSTGVMIPSRDMLVRAAAPKQASGKVFGFVYSGLDVGSAGVPIVFGWFLDHGHAPWVFVCMSIGYALAIGAVAMTGSRQRYSASAAVALGK